jgi:hypothetical protein
MHANSPKSSGRQNAPTCGKREATQSGEKEKGNHATSSTLQNGNAPMISEKKEKRDQGRNHATANTH